MFCERGVSVDGGEGEGVRGEGDGEKEGTYAVVKPEHLVYC